MKILCIGNSFSQDATRYLYGIARAGGVDVKVVNLYIGGCSLSRHYRNMLSEERVYAFEINGMQNTGILVSIKEALLSDDWDVVTLQQQSSNSARYETFSLYLERLADYVRTMAPKARIFLHQTWAYKETSAKLISCGYSTHEEMFLSVRQNYERARQEIGADGILLSGEAVLLANEAKECGIYRDEFHMSRGFGRYMLGLVWYKTLTGGSIEENSFSDFDEVISEQQRMLAKACAERATSSIVKQ